MAQSDLTKLQNIKAFFFDVDGVFTDGSLLLSEKGEMLRTMNIRDGYAVRHAIDKGLHVFIISGGSSEGVRVRFQNLGVKEIHLGIDDKSWIFLKMKEEYKLETDECLYMGDDLPDFKVMDLSGIKVAPNDAAWEIREKADFITRNNGGRGAVREIIENVMTLQGVWQV
jgi:3-deoxy-D-manno-octulosonate 8-phosphate phosphatase (KDO 8-P phosphatase)